MINLNKIPYLAGDKKQKQHYHVEFETISEFAEHMDDSDTFRELCLFNDYKLIMLLTDTSALGHKDGKGFKLSLASDDSLIVEEKDNV